MGNMDIAERRLPQDGRTSFEHRRRRGGRPAPGVASRACTARTSRIRILEVSPLPPTLASLGLCGGRRSRATRGAIRQPEGGIVISGPTGAASRRPCTRRSSSSSPPERKIYTVEDPIERKIDGIVQTEIKPLIGLTFAQALRSLVRADPDVIMVGEVRDLETAKMAADAAITGHLVFTTLHTNDAAPRSTGSSRWACRATSSPPPTAASSPSASCGGSAGTAASPRRSTTRAGESSAWARRRDAHQGLRRRSAAPKCFGTGYLGRLGLYEVLRRRRRDARADRHRRHRRRHRGVARARRASRRCATTACARSSTAPPATSSCCA